MASAETIQPRFNQNGYGEVNSYLRYTARGLRVSKLGILVRDPIEVWKSICMRKAVTNWEEHLNDYARAIDAMAFLKDSRGATVINFHRMVTDPSYTQRMIKAFGIHDVSVTQAGVEAARNISRPGPRSDISSSHLVRIEGFRARVLPWLLHAPDFT